MDGGKGPPRPGRFFASEYTIVNEVLAGEYRQKNPVDAEFRPRLEKVFERILRECLEYNGEPTENQRMLARFSVEAVGSILFNDRFHLAKIDRLVDLSQKVLEDTRYSSIKSEHGIGFYRTLMSRYSQSQNPTK